MNLYFWDILREYLALEVLPQAEGIDRDAQMLTRVLQGFGDRRLLGLRIPAEFGGWGLSDLEYAQATVEITAASGLLAFVQTQHQSAAAQIARYGNTTQRAWLPDLVTGQRKIGVGFSHLRRRGQPTVMATPQGDGYRLSGTIPWITGYGLFDQAIAGATLPNGDELYGLIPLETATQGMGGTLDCGEPLALTAMGISNTVAVHLENWWLSPADVLVIKPAGSIHNGDRQKVLHHSFYCLGCAQGALNYLKKTDLFTEQLDYLRQRLDTLQKQIFTALTPPIASFDHQLSLRAAAVAIAQDFARIAVVTAGGAGNLANHPAQRLYREALMFSVFGQTSDIRNATLQVLIPGKTSGYTKYPVTLRM